jgi:hypothetical protein
MTEQNGPQPGDLHSATERPVPHRRSAWPWVVAAVLIALILVGAYTIRQALRMPERTVNTAADRLEGMAGKVFEKLREGLRPNVTVRSTVRSQFAKLDATPKLVVLTDTIDVEVAKSSEKRVLWGLLNLGTTAVRLKAPGNKVQFYIPLGEIRADDFVYQPAAKKVVVRLPAPVLDRQVVDVQSDPLKIEVETKVGWARLSAYSGKTLEAKAREALRQEVLSTADTPPMHDLARLHAEKTLRAFFAELEAALEDGVRLEFEFKAAKP